MRLVVALSKRLDIPIVPHFMDDWIDNLFADGQLMGYARRAVVRGLEEVLERSPICLTIGDDMQREYSRRLDRPCVAVGNSVDLATYQNLMARRAEVAVAGGGPSVRSPEMRVCRCRPGTGCTGGSGRDRVVRD